MGGCGGRCRVLLRAPRPQPRTRPPPTRARPPTHTNTSRPLTHAQLWDALNMGNTTITLGAHIQFTPGGKWWKGAPPPIISPVSIVTQCKGFGSTCIIDMNGAPYPLFWIQQNALFSGEGVGRGGGERGVQDPADCTVLERT